VALARAAMSLNKPLSPQEEGRIFETEIAEEFALQENPASGAVWYSKLDLRGYSTRWWLRLTKKRFFRLTQDNIDEAVRACYGPGGDGSLPIWAIRVGEEKYDLIFMRKNDFKLLIEDEIDMRYVVSDKNEKKKRRAALPILMREEEND